MGKVSKRALGLMLAVVVIFSGFTGISGYADGTNTLYENTYDNGLSSCTAYDDTSGTVTYGGNIETTSYQGNTGMAMKSTTWPAKAISYAFKSPVSTGVISVSYDTSLLGRDSAAQGANIRLNDSKYVFYMKTDRGMYGPANNLSGYGDTSVTTSYSLNTVYTVNLVYDLTNKIAYTYVNDVLLTQRTIPAGFTISSIDFYLSMVNAYFDNLKISTMTNNSFSALSVGKVDRVGKTCDIYFSEEPKSVSCILTGGGKNVTVTKGGQPVSITSITDLPGRALRLEFEDLIESGDYTISFGNSFVNIMDKPLSQSSITFNVQDVELSTNGRTISATVKNAGSQPLTATLIVGVYANNHLIQIPVVSDEFIVDGTSTSTLAVGKTGEITVMLDEGVRGDIRAFLWNNLSSMQPLCGKITAQLQ